MELEVRGEAVVCLGPPGTQLSRIVGEALTNARRHSSAHTIRLLLRASHERLVVQISDDGRGFDPAAASSTDGTGIRGDA